MEQQDRAHQTIPGAQESANAMVSPLNDVAFGARIMYNPDELPRAFLDARGGGLFTQAWRAPVGQVRASC